jgi:hypothetical protein
MDLHHDIKVPLGDSEYTVKPQPYPYLRFRLRGFIGNLGTSFNADASDLMGMLGGNAYALLEILIPGLMPRYQFEGYPNQEAYEADMARMAPDYEGDEVPTGPTAAERAPTNPEIINAVQKAAAVNNLDIVKHLKGVFGGDDGAVKLLGKRLVLQAASSLMPGSPSLPSGTDSVPSTSPTTSPSEEPFDAETTEASGSRYTEATAEDVAALAEEAPAAS